MEEEIKKADDLIRQGKSSLAVSILKGLIKTSSDFAYLHYLLGIARMKCGRFFLAKKALEKADELLPGHADNLRSLGLVKVMTGDLEGGRKDLREAISLDLTNPLSYLDLAMSYFQYYEFEEGFELLERAKALEPQNPYILDNYKIAKDMEKELSKYSKADLDKMKREKLDPKARKSFHLFVLEKFFEDKPLTKDEMEEIKEELEMSGLGDKTIIYQDRVAENLTKEGILKRRREIEKALLELLEKSKINLTLEDVKRIIYNEKDDSDFSKIISIVDKGQNMEELKEILQLLNDAWNYFPHKCLNGLCPAEKVLKFKKGDKI